LTFAARFRLVAPVRTLKPFVWVLGLLLLAAGFFAVRLENTGSIQTSPSAGYFPSSKLHVDIQATVAPASALDDSDDETKISPPALQNPDRAGWLLVGEPSILSLSQPVVRVPDRRTATLVGIVLILV
jgi:hypothetical protein